MKISKLLVGCIAVLCTAFASQAQNATISPYSRFGYGLLNDNATSAQRSMGGVGYAMNSGRQINVMNPAAYAAIDTLTFLFDMGADFTTLWSKDDNASDRKYGGGLDYITLQVPIGRHMGASAGILPFSSVGYSFGNAIDNGSSRHSGSGSINQAYLGFAGNPFKGFYIGANISYLFGSTVNDVYAYTLSGSTTIFQREMQIKDWRALFGMQYSANIGSKNRVTLGLTYSPAKDFHGETYGVFYDADLDVKPDTIGYSKLKNNFSMPETWGAGINYQWAGRLMVEADFTYQPWSKAKYNVTEAFEQNSFSDRWRVGLGMQFTPNPRGSYLQRTQYRLGTYFNRDYINILDNNVREYGLTLGVGLPVPSFKTVVNLGLEFKHRQAHPNPLLKENYLNITLGINFNEMWFRQNRIY